MWISTRNYLRKTAKNWLVGGHCPRVCVLDLASEGNLEFDLT